MAGSREESLQAPGLGKGCGESCKPPPRPDDVEIYPPIVMVREALKELADGLRNPRPQSRSEHQDPLPCRFASAAWERSLGLGGSHRVVLDANHATSACRGTCSRKRNRWRPPETAGGGWLLARNWRALGATWPFEGFSAVLLARLVGGPPGVASDPAVFHRHFVAATPEALPGVVPESMAEGHAVARHLHVDELSRIL